MSVCVTGELIQEEEAEVVEEAVSVSIEEFEEEEEEPATSSKAIEVHIC